MATKRIRTKTTKQAAATTDDEKAKRFKRLVAFMKDKR